MNALQTRHQRGNVVLSIVQYYFRSSYGNNTIIVYTETKGIGRAIDSSMLRMGVLLRVEKVVMLRIGKINNMGTLSAVWAFEIGVSFGYNIRGAPVSQVGRDTAVIYTAMICGR